MWFVKKYHRVRKSGHKYTVERYLLWFGRWERSHQHFSGDFWWDAGSVESVKYCWLFNETLCISIYRKLTGDNRTPDNDVVVSN